ncbi:MAG TPA: lipocalin-like domain-containing protein, partial [Verrucomicrobiota bacterium]|nr:lipocalin-like domain-containing protein [Verrucomicrobiota bacterium]
MLAVPVRATDGFALPQPGRQFVFPRDHGSHPEFRIEWWYLTGHLWDAASNRFGFQATFFRTAAPRTTNEAAGTPGFGSDQLFLAHMAVSEPAKGSFLHQERLNREGWDAGADTNTLRLWNGNWSLEFTDTASETLRLRGGARGDAAVDLELRPTKPLVVFGTDGVSRKGASPAAASHYLTFPRLAVAGTLTRDGRVRAVSGQAWMDHEFSSSQLDAGQVGWDWASIQLHDGRDIMLYRLRLADGGSDPHSTLAWVERDGRVRHFGPERFRLEPLARWRSPRTGGDYPLGLRITLPAADGAGELALRLEPLLPDQELPGAIGGVP